MDYGGERGSRWTHEEAPADLQGRGVVVAQTWGQVEIHG